MFIFFARPVANEPKPDWRSQADRERALFPEVFFAKAKTRDTFLKSLQGFAISLRKVSPMLAEKDPKKQALVRQYHKTVKIF
ncbi:MAG: hypothetical protein AAF934_10510 [Bacteroidota bacterium]